MELLGSHPARGAWIEIRPSEEDGNKTGSHPARGAWIEIPVSPARFPATLSRTPHGVRGLKYTEKDVIVLADGRTPHGVRGLK